MEKIYGQIFFFEASNYCRRIFKSDRNLIKVSIAIVVDYTSIFLSLDI